MHRHRLPARPVRIASSPSNGVVFEKPCQCVDESRRAESTLRTVVIDHRLLDRAELPVVCDPLDRDNVHAVELMDRLNARDARPISDGSAVGGPGQDRASAAIAFGAADLGADQAALAQELDQRQKNGTSGDRQPLAVHINDDMIPHTIGALEQRARSRINVATWL